VRNNSLRQLTPPPNLNEQLKNGEKWAKNKRDQVEGLEGMESRVYAKIKHEK